jgi:hypothetical protein
MWLSYNDIYDVSDDGQVKNKNTGEITNGSDNGGGYLRIAFWPTLERKCIHVMIAERFLPRIIRNGDEVDHINRDNTDNRAINLRWCDKRTNALNRNFKLNKSGHKHIHITQYGTYCVTIRRRPIVLINKKFKTLEEAITARDDILNSEEYKT